MEPLINTMNSQMPICEMKPLISVETRRITVLEIAQRLDVGRLAVYAMLEQKVIPGIRLGRRWIITRHAYEQWSAPVGAGRRWTCGATRGNGVELMPVYKRKNRSGKTVWYY